MFRLVQGQALRAQVRYSSTSSKPSAVANVTAKAQAALNTSLYYTKVTGELLKYVWVHENLSPPTMQQIQRTFTTDAKALFEKALESSKDPKALQAKVLSWTKNDYIVGGAAIVQLLGLFSLGEIIGRRHIYGYKEHH